MKDPFENTVHENSVAINNRGGEKMRLFQVRNGVKEYSHNEFRYTQRENICFEYYSNFEGCKMHVRSLSNGEITNVLRNFWLLLFFFVFLNSVFTMGIRIICLKVRKNDYRQIM